jgi:FkbM family methyltransferase
MNGIGFDLDRARREVERDRTGIGHGFWVLAGFPLAGMVPLTTPKGRFTMRAVFQSAEREQEMVGAFLPERGFFVEVGAFHPTELSQTFHLEQRGWDGLLIEPVPEHATRLATRRARVAPVACGSRKQHGTHLPIYVAGGYSSLRYQVGPAVSVPVVTLDSVLEQANVDHIDFLSIDVEGAEVDVLDGLSLRYRPLLILLEDHAENVSKHRPMRRRGYKRVRRTGLNS